MIRILHIGMSDSLGGIENFIINMYRNIDKDKIQFDFIDFTNNEIYFKKEIENNGGKIYKVVSRRKNVIKNYKQLKTIIVKNNYNIVHFHITTMSYIAPILICNKLKNTQIIVHNHNQYICSKFLTKFLHYMNLLLLKNTKYIKMACSNAAGESIFKNNNFIKINNSIDLLRFKYDFVKRKKIREELKIEENIVLGHIGRFNKIKNHEYLIEIFDDYRKKRKNVKLLLLGDGELYLDIKNQVVEKKIEKDVIFLGNQKNVEDYYNAMDIFLFPSLSEGLGMVLIEAQANGLPIFASNIIPAEVNVTGKINFFDLKNDKNLLVNALLDSKHERYDELQMINAAGYNIKKEVKKLEELYIKMIKEQNEK